MMDEQEQDKQEIGDGSDDFAEGVKKAAEAADNSGQSGEKNGDGNNAGSKNEDPASNDNDKNSKTPDSKDVDSNSDNTGSKSSDNHANTPETNAANANSGNPGTNANNSGNNTQSPQNASGGNNPAASKGAEAGANQAQQAMQSGAEAGANIAQKSAEAGAEVAAKGVEAGANAAAAAVQAGEAGAAVAEVAAGTAAGGPWGAIIAAAWAMRHTLFKLLVCICLVLVFLVAIVVSIPSLVIDYVLGKPAVNGASSANMYEIFEEMSVIVAEVIKEGYEYSLEAVELTITHDLFDFDYYLSKQSLINYGLVSADYDVSYIIAAYSVSMEQKGTKMDDMIKKLRNVKHLMFPVTCEMLEAEVIKENSDGETEIVTVSYVECTIHGFNRAAILHAFRLDPTAQYGGFSITVGEAIDVMTNGLKMMMYGAEPSGGLPDVNDAELVKILSRLTCSPNRAELVKTAFSLVGKVPYFWGGKSEPGWNDEWNEVKLVTSIGSSTTGTLRPYGLDCTGFTQWVYKTVFGEDIGEGSWAQWDNSRELTADFLQPGDLGYMEEPGTSTSQHVLMYVGKDASGNLLWVHCEFGMGVHVSSPDYVKFYRRIDMDEIDLWG